MDLGSLRAPGGFFQVVPGFSRVPCGFREGSALCWVGNFGAWS